jgi:hypothetical protein
MTETKKAFKDYDISDFKDMGSLPKWPETTEKHRPFIPFIKAQKGMPRMTYRDYPTSKLADVL